MDTACVMYRTPARSSFVVARPLSTSRRRNLGPGSASTTFWFCSATPFGAAVTGRGHSPRPVSFFPAYEDSPGQVAHHELDRRADSENPTRSR